MTLKNLLIGLTSEISIDVGIPFMLYVVYVVEAMVVIISGNREPGLYLVGGALKLGQRRWARRAGFNQSYLSRILETPLLTTALAHSLAKWTPRRFNHPVVSALRTYKFTEHVHHSRDGHCPSKNPILNRRF